MPEPWVTILLIAVLGWLNYLGKTDSIRKMRWAYMAQGVKQKDWVRIFGCGLMHMDWSLYAVNALTIFWYGGAIEQMPGLGPIALLAFFGIGIGAGSLVSYWIRPDGTYLMWGSSGGSVCLMFASFVISPESNVWGVPGWLFSIPFVIGSAYRIRSGFAYSGHVAHLGGMACGIVLGMGFLLTRDPAFVLQWRILVMVVMAGGGLYYLKLNPFAQPDGNTYARMNPFYKSPEKRAQETLQKMAQDAEAVNTILDKISAQGIQSLTAQERKILEQSAKKKRG